MADIKRGDRQNGAAVTAWTLLRAVVSGILSAFLSALLFTAILLAGEDPNAFLGLFAYAAVFIGAAVSGVVGAVCDRSRAAVNAVLGGALYSLVMLAVSLVISGSTGGYVNALEAMLVYGGCIPAALVVGLMLRPRRVRIGEGRKNPAAMARKKLGRR